MSDMLQTLKALRRPRMLISAARFGLSDYRRDRDLRRLLQHPAPPAPEAALRLLMAREEELESQRQAGDAAYGVARHVDLMIALMGEIRLLQRARIASVDAQTTTPLPAFGTQARHNPLPARARQAPEAMPPRSASGQPKASGSSALRRAT